MYSARFGALVVLASAISTRAIEPESTSQTAPFLNDSASVFLGQQDVFGIQLNSTFLPAVSPCCAIIDIEVPGIVFYASAAEYQQQSSTYYSTEQADMQPSCRISPTKADDVSVIVRVASENKCLFSVRSGGHMHHRGASNIDAPGFTIDLQRLNSISLSGDQKTVSFGSGNTWKRVYDMLGAHGLATLGGRASSVGVGGFLLGGGLSFLSYEFGFASESILAYEVVLADSTIAIVTAHSHSDLYWALKYGSTNFGIVTRFEMKTYPVSELVWGGVAFYDMEHVLPLMESLVQFMAKLVDDPKGMTSFGIAWNPDAKEYVVCSVNIYLGPQEFPPLFSDLAAFTPMSSTLRLTNVVNFTDEVSSLLAGGIRVAWRTWTIKADAQILVDLHAYGANALKPLQDRSGFNFALNSQPINVGLIAAGRRNGGNPFGLLEENGDLILVLATLSWLDPEDDHIFETTFEEFSEWAEAETHARGLLTPFVYMNYAPATKDVMSGLGPENLHRLREIRDVYDPNATLRTYWKGGFKL